MNELVGKEGGLTGGLVGQVIGQYVVPAGVGIGAIALATRGRKGLGSINPFRKQLTAKQSVELKGLAERIKSGGTPSRTPQIARLSIYGLAFTPSVVIMTGFSVPSGL